MQNQVATDKNVSFTYRFTRNTMVMVITIFSIIFFITFLVLGFKTEMYFLWFYGAVFMAALILNLSILRKRARFYLAGYSIDENYIHFNYYDKNEPIKIKLERNSVEFYFGAQKGIQYLVVWTQDKELFEIYRGCADHKSKFSDIRNVLKNFVPAHKLKTYKRLFNNEEIYTRVHGNSRI
jgi:hypothetical protein